MNESSPTLDSDTRAAPRRQLARSAALDVKSLLRSCDERSRLGRAGSPWSNACLQEQEGGNYCEWPAVAEVVS